MKNKNTTLSEHLLNSIKTILEADKIDTPNSQEKHRSLYWLGTDTSIKDGGLNLSYGPKPNCE